MMNILAYAREDGWAYVDTGKGIFLVRPPYARSAMAKADDHAVEKAVSTHGFTALGKEFSDWKAITEFLNSGVVQYRNERGHPIPEAGEAGRQLLEFAPPDVLSRFLDRIEMEWLPAQEWENAQDLLLAMLQLPAVKSAPALYEKSTSLLTRCMKLQSEAAKRREALIEPQVPDRRFGLVYEHYDPDALTKYKDRITERTGSLMVRV
jgi:hypothetical protein